MCELEVFAASRRVALRAHGVLHAFDILFEVIQGAEDVLHALAVVQRGARLIGLHVDGTTGLLGHLEGQRLDDLTGWTLKKQGRSVQSKNVLFYDEVLADLETDQSRTYRRTRRSDSTGISLLAGGTLREADFKVSASV